MKDAVVGGKKVYGVTVKIEDACMPKAARAFLVFKALEDLGEVVVTDPTSQDIEDEKFDFVFSLFIITDQELDKITAA